MPHLAQCVVTGSAWRWSWARRILTPSHVLRPIGVWWPALVTSAVWRLRGVAIATVEHAYSSARHDGPAVFFPAAAARIHELRRPDCVDLALSETASATHGRCASLVATCELGPCSGATQTRCAYRPGSFDFVFRVADVVLIDATVRLHPTGSRVSSGHTSFKPSNIHARVFLFHPRCGAKPGRGAQIPSYLEGGGTGIATAEEALRFARGKRIWRN